MVDAISQKVWVAISLYSVEMTLNARINVFSVFCISMHKAFCIPRGSKEESYSPLSSPKFSTDASTNNVFIPTNGVHELKDNNLKH